MRAIGALARLKDKEPFGMLKETSTEVNSRMTWRMASENIHISTVLDIRDNLSMICKKEMARKSGSTEPNT